MYEHCASLEACSQLYYRVIPVACTINVYDCKFYNRKLRLSLERNYDHTIIILAMAS